MMYKQAKALFRKYCFITTVIGCAVMFCCGTLTASQKTAYNIYLKKYSVMSMTNTSQRVGINIDGEDYSLTLPDKERAEEVKRLLKFTPLAPFVFLIETLSEK